MKIEKLSITSEGCVHCHSCFYSSQDGLSSDSKFNFSAGINRLYSGIDSGSWAVSYLLSMYCYRPKDFVLFEQPEITVNNSIISLSDMLKYSCYMDKLYPLFSTKKPVKKLILDGLKREKSNYTPNDIKELFYIDNDHFERPLTNSGDEIFKAMAAIGYCYNKQVFCFPWLSKKRFDGFYNHMTVLLDVLAYLKKTVILPIEKDI